MAGRMINGAVAFSDFVRPARDVDESGAHRVLPVLPELSNLLPSQGLRRGSTVAIGLAPPASASRNAGPGALSPRGFRSGRAARDPSTAPSALRDPSALRGPVSGIRGVTRGPDSGAGTFDADSAHGSPGPELSSAGGSASGLSRPGVFAASRLRSEARASEGVATRGSVSGRQVLSPSVGSLSAEAAGPGVGDLVRAGGRRAVGERFALVGGVSAAGNGSTSLLLALLAAASRAGSWCAVVGVPTLGAVAAAESGVALDRLALVPNPGPEWPTVVAALIDGVDVVVFAVPGPVSPAIASRLVARARQRGCVLVPYGNWDGADVTLQVTQGHWEGLGDGHGRLRRRMVTVVARGRGAAARPREITMWMPGIAVPPPSEPASRPPGPAPTAPSSGSSGPRSPSPAGSSHSRRPSAVGSSDSRSAGGDLVGLRSAGGGLVGLRSVGGGLTGSRSGTGLRLAVGLPGSRSGTGLRMVVGLPGLRLRLRGLRLADSA